MEPGVDSVEMSTLGAPQAWGKEIPLSWGSFCCGKVFSGQKDDDVGQICH